MTNVKFHTFPGISPQHPNSPVVAEFDGHWCLVNGNRVSALPGRPRDAEPSTYRDYGGITAATVREFVDNVA